mmetsp:Transcript_16696/g.25490  ORF Transcript_16696/g.25490 Transcript_16696/m.25490 type:complete len:237 (-) Transcript_16696:326-1036(-)
MVPQHPYPPVRETAHEVVPFAHRAVSEQHVEAPAVRAAGPVVEHQPAPAGHGRVARVRPLETFLGDALLGDAPPVQLRDALLSERVQPAAVERRDGQDGGVLERHVPAQLRRQRVQPFVIDEIRLVQGDHHRHAQLFRAPDRLLRLIPNPLRRVYHEERQIRPQRTDVAQPVEDVLSGGVEDSGRVGRVPTGGEIDAARADLLGDAVVLRGGDGRVNLVVQERVEQGRLAVVVVSQ